MRSAARRRRRLIRRLVTLVAACAAAALLYNLLVGREGPDVEIGTAVPPRGYFLDDATLTEMGPDGRPRVVVHARTIEQQLDDQSVDLDDLSLDYMTRDYGPWHVTADRGHMPADRESIQLSGDVVVTGAQDRGAAVIRTEHLQYFIDSGRVQTADPVAVRLGKHVLNARGLHAELNAGTLKLESNVNGRFNP